MTWWPHDIDLWVASSHDEYRPCEKVVTKCAEWIAAFDQPRAYDLTECEGYPDSEDEFTPKEPSVLRADSQRWLQENFDESSHACKIKSKRCLNRFYAAQKNVAMK